MPDNGSKYDLLSVTLATAEIHIPLWTLALQGLYR